MTRARLRLSGALLALAAMLALALAPTVSRAMAAQGDPIFAGTLCSSSGMKALPTVPGDGPAAPPADGAMLDQCGLCVLQAAGTVPPCAGHGTPVASPGLTTRVPLLFLAAPRPLFAWSSAAPRGPPLPV